MTSLSRLGRARPSFSIRVRLPNVLLAASILVAAGARAQAPTLVKDISPGVSATASPRAAIDRVLGVSNGRVFMNASIYDAYTGLWVTDGTAAGTRQLLDIAVGSGADVGGTFTFSVGSPWGVSLWRSNGTSAGTAFVSPIGSDPFSNGGPARLTTAGGRLYFLFDDGIHGYEPWTSDGTEAGTKLLKDVTPGPTGTFSAGSTSYASLVGAGGLLFFACPAYSTPGCGLWRSDGTEAGTFQVADLSTISSPVNENGTLFFAASDGTHGAELWKSDGTAVGTVLVRDIVPGASGSAPSNLVSHGGALYFRLGSNGPIWKSDGTEAGTGLVHSQQGSGPLVSSGDRLFSASGSQLWASDGSEPGTILVRDFGAPFSLSTAATVPGALLLWVDRGVDGLELWRSDGTPAGTTLVKTVEPGNADASAGLSVSIPGAAVFLLWGTPSPLWRSDGTPAGTYSLLEPQFLPNDSHPSYLTDVNGTLLFSAADADHGRELWRSDGTLGGTVLVKDLEPGPGDSAPSQLFATPSLVYFTALTSSTGYEVYRTDGTEAGTFLIKDVQPGTEYCPSLGLLGELLIFSADDGVHGLEPWRTDGTSDGTYLLRDLTPGAAVEHAQRGRRPERRLLLRRVRRHHDGSLEDGRNRGGNGGRRADPDVLRSRSGVRRRSLLLGDRPRATGPSSGERTVRQAGTSLFLDINSSGSSSPIFVGRLGGRLVLWADDGAHGSEPWVTDGTPAGTSLLKDLYPGPARSGPGSFTIRGSTLFFFAHDGVHGFEPWKTDGTAAGTVLVHDVAPGPAGSYFMSTFSTMGHEALFTASDHVSGREYWRTDGTEAGTTQSADLVPGLASGAPLWFGPGGRMPPVRSGGRIFFNATDGATGYELWSLPIPTRLHTITPCRIADTRDPAGPTGGMPLGSSQTGVFQVTGRCGIPSTALSIAANVTVVSPSAPGTLSVFAGGPLLSGSTEVPVTAGRTRALHIIPSLGTAGSLSVRTGTPAGRHDARPPRRERVLRMSRRRSGPATRRALATAFVALLSGTGAKAQTATLVKDIYPGVSSTASSAVTFEQHSRRVEREGFPEWVGSRGAGSLCDGRDLRRDTTRHGRRRRGRRRRGRDVLLRRGHAGEGIALEDGRNHRRNRVRQPVQPRPLGPFEALALHEGGEPPLFRRRRRRSRIGALDERRHRRGNADGQGHHSGTGRVVRQPCDLCELRRRRRHPLLLVRLDFGVRPLEERRHRGGTVPLASLEGVASLVNLSGTLFFTASDPAHGAELWKSDGTAAGTVLVRDLLPGAASASPSGLVTMNGALYFTLYSDGSLWTSDGTEAGTVPLGPLSCSNPLVPSGERLFFTVSGSQLWATDGTAAGTALARDFGTSFNLYSAVAVPGALLFWVPDGTNKLDLWRSDGTPAGTSLVKTIESASTTPYPGGSISISGAALLMVSNVPTSLFRSDGTPAGTVPVLDPVFLPNDGLPLGLIDLNGTLLFEATDADHGTELWRSDGTAGGNGPRQGPQSRARRAPTRGSTPPPRRRSSSWPPRLRRDLSSTGPTGPRPGPAS